MLFQKDDFDQLLLDFVVRGFKALHFLQCKIIGGAAGAGIGTAVGEATQNNRPRNDGYRH